jgi:hypothetical protein
MSDANNINNTNNEYGAPTKDYNKQVFGNRPNEVINKDVSASIRFHVEEMLKSVRTSMPGIVQKTFEKNEAVWVEVQPGLSGQLRNGTEFKLPIVRAPLCKLNIAGFEIDYPDPVQGDEVEIRCADRSIQTFIKEAGVGVPSSVSILNMNNAYVVPNSFSNVKRKRKGDSDKFTITKGNQKLEFTSSGTVVNDGTAKTARDGDSVTVTIPAETFVVEVSGGSGSPAVGVKNPLPIDVDGIITNGTDVILLPPP